MLPQNKSHRQYEAIRAFYIEKKKAAEVAKQYGYTESTVYSMARDFKDMLIAQSYNDVASYYFNEHAPGRKISKQGDEIRKLVILLRKKYLSIPDIKSILDAQDKSVSERHIYNILKSEGFARLPRRSKKEKANGKLVDELPAPKAQLLTLQPEEFATSNAGLFTFIPYIKIYGIDKLITKSQYPGSKQIPKLNSILAFVALKLSNVRRYSADDQWCMDRGLGLFAGLNVLPKTAWFTSYSSRVTRNANLLFLRQMHKLWVRHGLLSDTINIDFTSVPYWGEDSHLENNWSGTRHKALPGILAAIAQDPDSGIITYGDSSIRHDNESAVIIEFLDFYRTTGSSDLKYLVFDSRFTTYKNLSKLDDNQVKFLTIRRRGKDIINDIAAIPTEEWRSIKVPMAYGRTRQIKINDSYVNLKGYGRKIRQIAITGHGKIKPALIITNDFEIKSCDIIRKYARRWLIEKTISEQIQFFHLNQLSSSMVIKVDFDLTMTILAYNLYKLLAKDLPGFENNTAQSLFDKFIDNDGAVICDKKVVRIKLKKKRRLPVLLDSLEQYQPVVIPWFSGRPIKIEGATTT